MAIPGDQHDGLAVQFLPVNQAYVVTLGEVLVTLYEGGMAIGTLFDSLDDLDNALADCGLGRNGFNVTIKENK